MTPQLAKWVKLPEGHSLWEQIEKDLEPLMPSISSATMTDQLERATNGRPCELSEDTIKIILNTDAQIKRVLSM
jgi:hypothetical protein